MDNLTILDLFRLEIEAQAVIFNEGLLALETQPQSSQTLESLMRAAHAVKGAAAIAEVDAAENLAHILEEYFVTAQNQSVTPTQIQLLRRGVEALLTISQVAEADLDRWLSEHQQEIAKTIQAITTIFTVSESTYRQEIPTEITRQVSPPPPLGLSAVEVHLPITPPPPPSPPPAITEEVVNITDTSMLDLFRMEVEGQANILNEGLLSLETQPQSAKAPLLSRQGEILMKKNTMYSESLDDLLFLLDQMMLI